MKVYSRKEPERQAIFAAKINGRWKVRIYVGHDELARGRGKTLENALKNAMTDIGWATLNILRGERK